MYPNPTSDGTVTIFDAEAKALEVGVYDSSMRLVRSSLARSGDPVMLLSDVPDGTYTIVVRTGNDVHTTQVVRCSKSW